MIYLLYGDDEFSIQEVLTSMKEGFGPPDLRDVNITALDADGVGFDELRATCDTVPFLAEKRMVIVTGLLGQSERRWPSDARRGGKGEAPRELKRWSELPRYLPEVPETTELVFVDGRLGGGNRLLAAVRPHAKVSSFALPNEDSVGRWVRDRAADRGIEIEPAAVKALAETVGGDLSVIAGELDKLAVYRGGQPVRQEDVEELVSYAKESNIFVVVDAMIEGRLDAAVGMVHQLLRLGRTPGYILTMVARQVRLLILAKELRAQRVPADEQGRRLGLYGYPLRKTLEQERLFTAERLVQIHRKLLEADLQIKTTVADEGMVMDVLIAEVALEATR